MSPSEPLTFDSLGLSAALLRAVGRAGYTTPTPVQAASIPPLLQGRDLLGQAATGTGKTAAFALPILAALTPGASKPFETRALVLVPTRELALQVTESMRKYSDAMGIAVLAIYGGQEFAEQLRPLKRGVDVVVATPGRAIDHLKRKTLKLDQVRTVVLDEADEMLDMGFAEDLEVLLSALPAERQVALFSATMPSRILKIAERQMKNPVRVSIARPPAHSEAQKLRQVVYVTGRKGKLEALMMVLELEQPASALVFCRTRADVDELAEVLHDEGYATEALHGGLSQDQRDRVMKKFKSGAVKFVVATDVAARGIHVENLSHVINADVPSSPEVYVHRVGRTGRAGKEGVAITFAQPSEVRLIKGLERASGGKIQTLQVPSRAAVRAKKLAKTQQLVLDAMKAGAGEPLLEWVESLGESAAQVAAAAVAVLHRELTGIVLEAAPMSASERVHGKAGAKREPAPPPAPASGPTTGIPGYPSDRDESQMMRGYDSEAHPTIVPGTANVLGEILKAAVNPEATPPSAPNELHDVAAPRASAPRAPETEHAVSDPEATPPSAPNQPQEVNPPRASTGRAPRDPAANPTPPYGSGAAEELMAPRASPPFAPQAPREVEPPRASARRPESGRGAAERPKGHTARPSHPMKPPRASAPKKGLGGEVKAPRASMNRHAISEAQPAKHPRAAANVAKPPRASAKRPTARPPERRIGTAPRPPAPSRGKPGDVVTLFVGAGTHAGIRPGDLVGAIANEAGLHSKQIGPIEIRDMFSLVGVPKASADAVIVALQNTKLRGRKVKVRVQEKKP